MRRIEAVEADACGRHRVQVGRLQFRVAVVTRVAPALIIRHAEDDVGLALFRPPRGPAERRQAQPTRQPTQHISHDLTSLDTDASEFRGATFQPSICTATSSPETFFVLNSSVTLLCFAAEQRE